MNAIPTSIPKMFKYTKYVVTPHILWEKVAKCTDSTQNNENGLENKKTGFKMLNVS